MRVLDNLKKSEFLSHVITLMSGTVLAQFIFFVFSPLLARLYSPGEFGIYALFTSILGPLSIIVTGRYEQAIVIPEKDADAINIFALVILLSFIVTAVLTTILFFFNNTICNLLKAGLLGNWLYLIPPVLIFLSISQSSTYWFIRKKSFRASAINKTSQSSLNVASSVPLGLLHISKGLIIGDAVGKMGLAVISIYQSVKHGLDYHLVNLNSIRDNLKRYRQFPIYNTLPSLLVSLSLSIPIFYINSFYSGSETGLVNQTRIAIFIPLSLISSALSQVILHRLSDKRKKGLSVRNEFVRMFRNMVFLGILAILVIQISGVFLFKLVFGKDWIMSGVFAKILIFSYVIQFIVSPFSVIFIAYDRIKILSFWQIFYFFCILLLFFARFSEIKYFLILYTFIDCMCFMIYLYLIFKVLRDYESKITA